MNPKEAPSHADFVQLLERVRSRCYAAEEAMTRESAGPETAKALMLHQQLRKFATLKAMMSYRMSMEDDGGGSQLPSVGSLRKELTMRTHHIIHQVSILQITCRLTLLLLVVFVHL